MSKNQYIFTGVYASEGTMENMIAFQKGDYCQKCQNRLRNICNKHGKNYDTITAPEIVNMMAQEMGLSGDKVYLLMPNREFVYVK